MYAAKYRRQVPPKRRFLQEPHGVTTQKTPFFEVCLICDWFIKFCRSETGQKVKELEEELEVRKRDLLQCQHLVLKAKKEGGEMQTK
jgi:hypothetical protein